MAACVPCNEIDNLSYTHHFPVDEVKKVVEKIGVYKRRFVNDEVCASDLCAVAAEKLFKDTNTDRSAIDVLLFVSQTPDYKMPATSAILQHRLGLSTTTICLDINLGCSAFLYALTVAFSMVVQNNIRKVLILNGETRSRVYSPKDRKTAFLFGDAGVAALIEKGDQFSDSFFSLNTDGSLESLIKIKAGGYRYPSSVESLTERVVDDQGNIRNDEQGYMDGESVFNFVAREVPKDIRRVLAFSGCSESQIDYFVFHQANRFMNDFLVKKLKLPSKKVLSTIEKYGNTSSVSVPLTIISELKDTPQKQLQLCLSAFGVGLSWASAIIAWENCYLSDIQEL